MPEAAWLIVVWLIVVGAAVGSFLNVVVYRLPLGISLVHPPSHCPKCGKRIPWYDNVPVLGWIMLRGRCRQCHNPISMRYPVVEAITAAMFGAVAVVEMARFDMSEFYAIYPYHLLLLCTLLCAGLIEYDGHQPPVRLFVPAVVVGMTVILLWPALRPIGNWPVWLDRDGRFGNSDLAWRRLVGVAQAKVHSAVVGAHLPEVLPWLARRRRNRCWHRSLLSPVRASQASMAQATHSAHHAARRFHAGLDSRSGRGLFPPRNGSRLQ